MTLVRTYLDHNATGVLRPQAKAAVLEALEAGGNASSVHSEGREARRRLELARERVADLVGARADAVIFTSGGTEANNLAVRGAGAERLLVCATEHPSVLEAAEGSGLPVETVGVDGDGVIDLQALERALRNGRGRPLISVMAANNETGVLQPLRDVVRLARPHRGQVHADAVQAAGKMDLSLPALGVDMLTLSAHKLGGPQGVGALVVRDGVELAPIVFGGGQELRRRGGTENLPGAAGFGAAAVAARETLHESAARLGDMRDRLQARLLEITPDACVFSRAAERLPNTLCFACENMAADMLLIAFDLEGVAVSSGSACSSGKVEASRVLAAMGIEDDLAAGAIRVSLGWNSSDDDVERFVRAWRAIVERGKVGRAA